MDKLQNIGVAKSLCDFNGTESGQKKPQYFTSTLFNQKEILKNRSYYLFWRVISGPSFHLHFILSGLFLLIIRILKSFIGIFLDESLDEWTGRMFLSIDGKQLKTFQI